MKRTPIQCSIKIFLSKNLQYNIWSAILIFNSILLPEVYDYVGISGLKPFCKPMAWNYKLKGEKFQWICPLVRTKVHKRRQQR